MTYLAAEKEDLFKERHIRVSSGLYVNVFEPKIDMITIEDIAHGLSNQCRFGGHLIQFYSVAQHSIECCKLINEQDKLAALLHDASEAYLIDIPTPVKKELTNYKEIEDNLMRLIAEKFQFEWPMSREVKIVDEIMLQFEWDYLMLDKPRRDKDGKLLSFPCFTPQLAKQEFLRTFRMLKKE